MKKVYEKPEAEVICFVTEEIIANDLFSMAGGIGDTIPEEEENQ